MQKIFSVSSNKKIHRLLHQRLARHEEVLFPLAIATRQCGVAVIQQETKNIKNSDLCQPVKVEVLNVINCKVWVDIFCPCVSRVDVNPPVFSFYMVIVFTVIVFYES